MKSTEYLVPSSEEQAPRRKTNSVLGTRYSVLCALVAFVLGAAISLLLNVAVPQPVYKDDMPGGPYHYEGMFDPPLNSYGYFDEEHAPTGESYKWTTAHAYTTFPYAANAGSDAYVSIRMGAFQATAQNPISVEVRLNGQVFLHLQVAGAFQVYTARIDTRQVPNPYLDPAHVQIDLLSATRSTGQDPRQLGVAVDWIEVQPAKGQAEIIIEAAVWALFAALLALVAITRLGTRWGMAFVGLALLTFVLLHLTYMPRLIDIATEVGLAGVAWLLGAHLAPRKMPAVGLALAALLVWVVVAGRIFGEWQMDDAFISYRYAWNLVHGSGLVYNPGQPVEGYTNFLWTLMSAGAMLLGWDQQSVAQAANIFVSQCLIAVTFVASGWLVGRIRRPATDDGRWTMDDRQKQADSAFRITYSVFAWPLLVALLLAVDVSLLFYGAKGSGMESTSFALMVMLAVMLLWWPKSSARVEGWLRVGAGVALALGALLRPEGLFVAALLLLVRAWQDWRAGGRVWRLLVLAAVPFLIVIVPYQIWRFAYYGYPVPNTFYAKTGLTAALIERGLGYTLGDFALPHWLIAVPAFLGVVGWLVAWLRTRRGQSGVRVDGMLVALFVLTAVYTLYIIWAGGDHFPAARFFVPLLAPMVLLAQEALRGGLRLLGNNRTLGLAATGALGLAVLLYVGISLWLQTDAGPLGQRGNRETTAWERWGSAALWIRDETPPDTTLAAFAAGAMAYYSDRHTVDMLGITDEHIAHMAVPTMGEETAGHEKRDPVYVLAQRPDYILGTWEDYFAVIAAQVTANYGYETIDAPTGTPVKWLRRNDAKGP